MKDLYASMDMNEMSNTINEIAEKCFGSFKKKRGVQTEKTENCQKL